MNQSMSSDSNIFNENNNSPGVTFVGFEPTRIKKDSKAGYNYIRDEVLPWYEKVKAAIYRSNKEDVKIGRRSEKLNQSLPKPNLELEGRVITESEYLGTKDFMPSTPSKGIVEGCSYESTERQTKTEDLSQKVNVGYRKALERRSSYERTSIAPLNSGERSYSMSNMKISIAKRDETLGEKVSRKIGNLFRKASNYLGLNQEAYAN